MAIMGGRALCWKSKLHRLVTLSTCKAEFIEAVEAAKEMMWLCNLLGELGYPMTGPSTLYINNAGAVSVLYFTVTPESSTGASSDSA